MNHEDQINFFGYDEFVLLDGQFIPDSLPKKIKLVDTNRIIPVNLEAMKVAGDQLRCIIKLREKSEGLIPPTAQIFQFVMLHALNGRRKISTVQRWINELNLFVRKIREHTDHPIATFTFGMYSWYSNQKNPSQQKLLRSALLYWIRQDVPGISNELKSYLQVSKTPKPRSTIEIQSTTDKERPFSIEQVRHILTQVEDSYVQRKINPQEHLLWRLIISEAMRPSQLNLLLIKDIRIESSTDGHVQSVHLNVPIVKQQATPARKYMMEYRLSEAVGRAVLQQLYFLEAEMGRPPSPDQPIFSFRKVIGWQQKYTWNTVINISNSINKSKAIFSKRNEDLEDISLFTRRFKHTKLTHLAMLGAPIEVLARAGFQTSTVSLKHYVNLTDEAFVEYENLLSRHHDSIRDAFKGTVINTIDATNNDPSHLILGTDMENIVGSCSTNPCNVLTPIGCYVCPRFEAFDDGPHELVLETLMARKNHAVKMRLPVESIARDNNLILAVQAVVNEIKRKCTK